MRLRFRVSEAMSSCVTRPEASLCRNASRSALALASGNTQTLVRRCSKIAPSTARACDSRVSASIAPSGRSRGLRESTCIRRSRPIVSAGVGGGGAGFSDLRSFTSAVREASVGAAFGTERRGGRGGAAADTCEYSGGNESSGRHVARSASLELELLLH